MIYKTSNPYKGCFNTTDNSAEYFWQNSSVFYPIILILFISSVNGANQLHIGGIFPIAGKGGWQGGQACMPAAKLALQDVNENPDLLPGFNLTLHSNDSECEPGLGASVMYNLLYNSPQKLMLLAGCSTVCTTVAEAAKMWNLVVCHQF
ncbi:gamma-aminobutyric acid type B receptor subunit 1-like isoform X2 [Anopheles merus]|uniref:gamma-aminobutyric acid type B receptor subunit 1-like isoform X2 n=1 Tax=Anopheles merus TaxID=30066 RepID=UPI001BE4410F|nr:gamma-aminobutyric acid type B receptor subunit 1-like isoform X2 [Anopheles merus]